MKLKYLALFFIAFTISIQLYANTCWYSGNSYSDGASFNGFTCVNGVWKDNNKKAIISDANTCWYNGNFYNDGVSFNNFTCINGVWKDNDKISINPNMINKDLKPVTAIVDETRKNLPKIDKSEDAQKKDASNAVSK